MIYRDKCVFLSCRIIEEVRMSLAYLALFLFLCQNIFDHLYEYKLCCYLPTLRMPGTTPRNNKNSIDGTTIFYLGNSPVSYVMTVYIKVMAKNIQNYTFSITGFFPSLLLSSLCNVCCQEDARNKNFMKYSFQFAILHNSEMCCSCFFPLFFVCCNGSALSRNN